jgi:beta-lactamase superfamily II metal-dependent hydrolase
MAEKKTSSSGSSNSKNSSKSSSSASSKAKKTVKKQAKKYAKKHKKGVAIFVAIVVILIIVALVAVYVLKPELFKKLFNDGDNQTTNESSIVEGDLADIASADLSVHFLELGNKYAGDSVLIKSGDTEVLIDAGSRTNSATTINDYVKNYCTDGKLEYVIATHAHQDHIAGFVGTTSGSTKTGILYTYQVGTLIQFAGHNTTSTIYNNYVTATEYAASQGASVYTAKQCWYETDGAQKSYALNEDGSLTLNILYNYYYDNETSDENNYSVCVLLTQTLADGSTKNYMFTGDLEEDGESKLVDNNTLPQVELFKGGHHGSKTSSTAKLLSAIQPKNVAVCCCAGSTEYTTNNDNTFPTQAFVDRISVYTKNVYVTSLCVDYSAGTYESMNGNIVFYYSQSEGEESGSLKLWCSNNTTVLKDTDWFKQYRTTPSAWSE